jgi:hypothetical protein
MTEIHGGSGYGAGMFIDLDFFVFFISIFI